MSEKSDTKRSSLRSRKINCSEFSWFSCQFSITKSLVAGYETAHLQHWYSECMFLSVVVSMFQEYWGVVSSFLALSLELLNGA